MSTQSDFLRNLGGGAQNAAVNKAADLISGTPRKDKNANKQNTGGIQNFLTEISSHNGLYRPTFFEVQISNFGTSWEDGRSFSLLCHNAALPGMRVDTIQNTIYGLPYEVPVGMSFSPFWCSFYVDNAFNLPGSLFNEFAKRIDFRDTKNESTNVSWSPKYRNDSPLLIVDVMAFSTDITQNSTANNSDWVADGLPVVSKYTLRNAFVKEMQQVNLDWSAHDQMSSITLELSYEWFENSVAKPTEPPKAIEPEKKPLNFDTIVAKYPALGVAYDAAKRTVQQSSIMNNPILNQGSQFLP